MVLPIVLAVFVVFALFITWRPSVVVAMAVCVYPFEQWAQANSSFFALHSTLINLGFGLLTLEALAIVIARGQNPWNPSSIALGVWLLLYFWAAISCFWSLDVSNSFFLFRYYMPYNITFILLLPMVLQKPEDLRTGMIATLFFGTFVMIMLLVSTQIHGWGRTIEVGHGQGVINRVGKYEKRLGPLAIAETCGQLMLIAILMQFAGVNKIWSYARWLVAFLAMALIYRSGSRGQLIAALFSLVLFMPLSRGVKQITGWVATMVSLFIIGGVAFYSFTGFAGEHAGRWNLESMQSNFASTRLELCAKLFEFWATSQPFTWFFGLGSSASYDARLLGIYCHVVPVEILTELGILGTFVYCVFLYFVARDAIRLYSMLSESPIERSLAVTLMAMVTYQMLLTFKQGSFITHTFTYCVCILTARQAALVRIAQRKERMFEMKKRWYNYQLQVGTTSSVPNAPVPTSG